MKQLLCVVLACASCPPPATAQQTLADPAHMSRGALASEVALERPFVANGGVALARPPGCDGPENRQLDFWVGEWDIALSDAPSVFVGEASVRSASQGCALLEDFRSFAGGRGIGLFGYSASDGAWRQTYIDASGTYGTAQARFENGIMVFQIQSPPPPPQFPRDMERRISFERIDADTVHQWGERLDPATRHWVRFFDLTYHRRPGTRS